MVFSPSVTAISEPVTGSGGRGGVAPGRGRDYTYI